jgi:cytochrome bd-type quinol oxidase subunit 1
MFTTGQLVFAVLFFVVFVIVMIYSYRGDKKLHKKYYKGSLWVLVGFIIFLSILMAIKGYFKN